MQNHYNLLYREEEREMTPTLKVSTFPHQLSDIFSSRGHPSTLVSARFRGHPLPAVL